MHKIKLSRRSFSKRLAAGLFMTSIQPYALSIEGAQQKVSNLQVNKAPEGGLLVSAATDHNKQHWLVILDNQGNINSKVPLPSRAHQINIQPNTHNLAVAARRPGTYLKIIDSTNGKTLYDLQPDQGHHFYGHSVYSIDGRYLYTTENHIESGEGRIFVRDSENNYQVIRSFPSYGIGPHELKIHPNGKSLVVANGGILTHPESGRAKLNIDTMSPSLAYLSIDNGTLLEQVELPKHLHKLSIRHIDINTHGLTAIAMQYQGNRLDNVPLVALHQQGTPLKTLWAPEHINRRMKNYCGSVCFNESGSIFAVTSPQGNLLTLWDAFEGEYITQFRCTDVCGVSPFDKHGFTFSNGLGKIYTFDMKSSVLKPLTQNGNIRLSWDNHLSSIG